MEAAKAMLHDQDLPMHLWAEAARIAMYVHNRTPHRVLENKTPEEVFYGKKPEVRHLRIFGCLMYIHIPKEKWTKFDPSGNKGLFMGYSERSKDYIIYFPRFKNIDISRDVKFDEDSAYKKSRKRPIIELEETEVPRIRDTTMNEATLEEDREMEEPQEPVDPPHDKNVYKRKLAWVREAIQGVERYGASEEMHRERKRTRSYSNYVSLLCDIIDKEPSNYEEAKRKNGRMQ